MSTILDTPTPTSLPTVTFSAVASNATMPSTTSVASAASASAQQAPSQAPPLTTAPSAPPPPPHYHASPSSDHGTPDPHKHRHHTTPAATPTLSSRLDADSTPIPDPLSDTSTDRSSASTSSSSSTPSPAFELSAQERLLLSHAAEIIPDKLYYVHFKRVCQPSDTDNLHLFSVEKQLRYEPFFSDFGPLNLGHLYRFCRILYSKIKKPKNAHKRIVFYSTETPQNQANSAYLIGSYSVLFLAKSPDDAYKPLSHMKFIPFRDASHKPCQYNLTVKHCIEAVSKAHRAKFFKNFNADEYDYYSDIEHGDLNLIIPGKFLAFAGPCESRVDSDGYVWFAPSDFLQVFKQLAVTAVVRLNDKQYEERVFQDVGISHYDMEYSDGTNPSKPMVKKFLRTVERQRGLIAVHCKAGLGRTGTCIGLYMMKHLQWSACDCIAWIRICRPGSIIGPQQMFLADQQARMWRKGSKYSRRTSIPREPKLILASPPTPPVLPGSPYSPLLYGADSPLQSPPTSPNQYGGYSPAAANGQQLLQNGTSSPNPYMDTTPSQSQQLPQQQLHQQQPQQVLNSRTTHPNTGAGVNSAYGASPLQSPYQSPSQSPHAVSKKPPTGTSPRSYEGKPAGYVSVSKSHRRGTTGDGGSGGVGSPGVGSNVGGPGSVSGPAGSSGTSVAGASNGTSSAGTGVPMSLKRSARKHRIDRVRAQLVSVAEEVLVYHPPTDPPSPPSPQSASNSPLSSPFLTGYGFDSPRTYVGASPGAPGMTSPSFSYAGGLAISSPLLSIGATSHGVAGATTPIILTSRLSSVAGSPAVASNALESGSDVNAFGLVHGMAGVAVSGPIVDPTPVFLTFGNPPTPTNSTRSSAGTTAPGSSGAPSRSPTSQLTAGLSWDTSPLQSLSAVGSLAPSSSSLLLQLPDRGVLIGSSSSSTTTMLVGAATCGSSFGSSSSPASSDNSPSIHSPPSPFSPLATVVVSASLPPMAPRSPLTAHRHFRPQARVPNVVSAAATNPTFAAAFGPGSATPPTAAAFGPGSATPPTAFAPSISNFTVPSPARRLPADTVATNINHGTSAPCMDEQLYSQRLALLHLSGPATSSPSLAAMLPPFPNLPSFSPLSTLSSHQTLFMFGASSASATLAVGPATASPVLVADAASVAADDVSPGAPPQPGMDVV